MLSFTEENYLKALIQLRLEHGQDYESGTNQLAGLLGVKPATATDMLKKLRKKRLIDYKRYGKISLTEEGIRHALDILRKHRLWETFLYEKLDFSWDEVHEVAEQLEHIHSPKLIDRLDKFLGYPKVDPHGDAIPNAQGELIEISRKTLTEIERGTSCLMVAVKDNSAAFLQYVVKVGLGLNTQIDVMDVQEYDGLMEIDVNGKRTVVSRKFSDNILVK
jgi:DtxR family Mn-dependent transcriptional regulator